MDDAECVPWSYKTNELLQFSKDPIRPSGILAAPSTADLFGVPRAFLRLRPSNLSNVTLPRTLCKGDAVGFPVGFWRKCRELVPADQGTPRLKIYNCGTATMYKLFRSSLVVHFEVAWPRNYTLNYGLEWDEPWGQALASKQSGEIGVPKCRKTAIGTPDLHVNGNCGVGLFRSDHPVSQRTS